MDLFECQGLFSIFRGDWEGFAVPCPLPLVTSQELLKSFAPHPALFPDPWECCWLAQTAVVLFLPLEKSIPLFLSWELLLVPWQFGYEGLWACIAGCFGNCQCNLLHFTLSGSAWCVITACPFALSCAVPAQGLHWWGCCDSAIYSKLNHHRGTSPHKADSSLFYPKAEGNTTAQGVFLLSLVFILIMENILFDHVSHHRSGLSGLVCCGCYTEKSG